MMIDKKCPIMNAFVRNRTVDEKNAGQYFSNRR